MLYDTNGNKINPQASVVDSSGFFSQNKLLIPLNSIEKINGDGIYTCNPWKKAGRLQDNNRIFAEYTFFDANKNKVGSVRNTSDYVIRVEGLNVYADLLQDAKAIGQININTLAKTLTGYPSYVKVTVDGDSDADLTTIKGASYGVVTAEELNPNVDVLALNDKNKTGIYEQIKSNTDKLTINGLEANDELARRMKTEIVRQMNQSRDAFRIATFNVYGAGHGQSNWDMLKVMLQRYGIDIVGMQEVKDPLATVSGNRKLADVMASWEFPHCSTNGELYPVNERMLLSRFPISSSSEWEYQQWSSDKRCCAKYEVELPRYKDLKGSYKLSIYNTQLEVYPNGGADGYTDTVGTNRLSEMQEVINAVKEDENPFIIILGDMNDFSRNHEIAGLLAENGFTPVHDWQSPTVTDRSCRIDNIFINERMKALNCQIVNGGMEDDKVYFNGSWEDLSDHDLVFADIEFNWTGLT